MTNSGYRDQTVLVESIKQYESLEAFMLAWLEEASQSKDWKQIWDAMQQLSFRF